MPTCSTSCCTFWTTATHGRAGANHDFRNTVVIMTSNIGSEFLLDGMAMDGEVKEKARDLVMGTLRSHFRPEFLNRIDATVLFKPLTLNEVTQIVDLLLGDLRKRLADRRITLRLTDEARHFIAEEGFDRAYGARPLRRFITREVETRLGRAFLRADLAEGDEVSVDVVDGQLMITSLIEASSASAVA